jgi:hypothetical protein
LNIGSGVGPAFGGQFRNFCGSPAAAHIPQPLTSSPIWSHGEAPNFPAFDLSEIEGLVFQVIKWYNGRVSPDKMSPNKMSRDKMSPVLYRRQNVAYSGMSPMFGDDFFRQIRKLIRPCELVIF